MGLQCSQAAVFPLRGTMESVLAPGCLGFSSAFHTLSKAVTFHLALPLPPFPGSFGTSCPNCFLAIESKSCLSSCEIFLVLLLASPSFLIGPDMGQSPPWALPSALMMRFLYPFCQQMFKDYFYKKDLV